MVHPRLSQDWLSWGGVLSAEDWKIGFIGKAQIEMHGSIQDLAYRSEFEQCESTGTMRCPERKG
jgi:hypothetical protein